MMFDTVENVFLAEKNKLYRSLVVATGDPNRAAEVLSETFAQAVSGQGRIRDVRSWVWATAFKLVRRGHAKPPPQEVVLADLSHLHGHHEMSPVVELLDLLKVLSPQQRQVVALRYLSGMSAIEIAAVIDSTPGSVRVQLHRAHRLLRRSVDEGEDHNGI